MLAAVVPGAFDAWLTMLRDHGTLELADVLEPAIYYAEGGHPMLARVAQTIETVSDMFREDWPTSAARLAARRVGAQGRRTVPQCDACRHIWTDREGGAGADQRHGSTRRATCSTAASSPRRSTGSAAPTRSWTCLASGIAGF